MLLVKRLLNLKEFKKLVTALLIVAVAFVKYFLHGLFPLWAVDLVRSVVICGSIFIISDICASAFDEKVTNESS